MKTVDICVIACVLASSGCVVPSIDAYASAAEYSIDGGFGATETSTVVTSDLEALGLDQEEVAFQPRADFRWIGMHLSVDYAGAEFSGEGVTEATIEVDGDTIDADAEVSTDLDFADLKGMFTFDVIPGDMIELGLGVGLSTLDFDLHMQEIDGNGEIDTEETLPVPLLAGRFAFAFGPFAIYADVGYMDAEVDDVDIVLADYEVGATVRVFDGAGGLAGRLIGGWRGIDIDADYQDDDSAVAVDFLFNGPFLGFGLTF